MANFNTDVNINPNYGLTVTAEPKIRKIQFGDGYEMSVQDSLNADLRTYSLEFKNLTTTSANSIDNFLTARKGVESFEWTSPTESSASRYKCEKWVRRYIYTNVETISASFREVVNL